MSKNNPPSYVGYQAEDYKTAYAKYFEEIQNIDIQQVVKDEIKKSPLIAGSLASVNEAKLLSQKGYTSAEIGYTLEADGSARVAVLTAMPNVTPKMWSWWFAWHGSHDNRYKLWHPKAHKSAIWQDGSSEFQSYIGRTSLIEEYIGKNLEKAAIRFFDPSELGLKDDADHVYICARLGYSQFPLDFGYLVHQIRSVEGGAEMRSRFWLGGSHIQLRIKGAIPNFLSKIIQKVRKINALQAQDLLTHCAEEMNHLAKFLPNIYKENEQY
jgi:DAPG hydrolase PhiG domain